jgi:hypothetical protein
LNRPTRISTWTSTTRWCDFVDLDGRPRQRRFCRDDGPPRATDVLCGTGQLIAVIADPQRPDEGDTVAIRRPGVDYTDVDAALGGWQSCAMITEDTVNLAEIRRRVHTAGLE